MEWSGLLDHLTAGRDLTRRQARDAMDEIMSGRADAAQVAAFVVALRMKGETVEEMAGLVEAMRANSVPVTLGDLPNLVDIVGTGGDRSHTFNISTTAALVAAGAGATVAKHGGRAASSKCGSADVLADSLIEVIGVELRIQPVLTSGAPEEAAPAQRPSGAPVAPPAPDLPPVAAREPEPAPEGEVSADDAELDPAHNAEELLSSTFGAEVISVRDAE